jgi:hypothetical protein
MLYSNETEFAVDVKGSGVAQLESRRIPKDTVMKLNIFSMTFLSIAAITLHSNLGGCALLHSPT